MKCLVIVLLAHFTLGCKQYTVFTKEANWYKARDTCLSQGMQLASVESLQDHNELIETIKRSLNYKLPKYTASYYLGAENVKFNHWTWVSSGSKVSYTNWGVREPNQRVSQGCVLMHYSRQDNIIWKWRSSTCYGFYYFVCECASTDCRIPPPEQCESERSRYESWQGQYKTVQSQYENAQRNYETAQSQYVTVQNKYADLQKQCETSQSQYLTAQSQNETTQGQYESLQKEHETLKSKCSMCCPSL